MLLMALHVKFLRSKFQVPEEVVGKVKKELEKYFNNVNYVRYFYEEGQDFWGCTCGRINRADNEICLFCNNSRRSQISYLIPEKMDILIAKKRTGTTERKRRNISC